MDGDSKQGLGEYSGGLYALLVLFSQEAKFDWPHCLYFQNLRKLQENRGGRNRITVNWICCWSGFDIVGGVHMFRRGRGLTCTSAGESIQMMIYVFNLFLHYSKLQDTVTVTRWLGNRGPSGAGEKGWARWRGRTTW